jgi:hypothetical protein
MREVMTKSMARNIFYGGSLFFILIFVGLTAQSHFYISHDLDRRDDADRQCRGWQAPVGKALLHQLPHDPGRGRLFRAGTGAM